jgi:hypothetical protein
MFEQWLSLDDFEEAIDKACPEEDRLRSNQFKFWREAWVAANFARRTGQTGVRLRLTADSSPQGDFELETADGRTHGYEIAEALDPSMPPALIKLRAAGGTVLQESEKSVSGALARSEIPRLIAQKAEKAYPARTGLIIYVNLWTDFERAGMAGLVPAEGRKFSSIWLLTSGRALQMFPTPHSEKSSPRA